MSAWKVFVVGVSFAAPLALPVSVDAVNPADSSSRRGDAQGRGVEPIESCLWSTGFTRPGPDDSVLASVVFDDGAGEALFVGGDFHFVDDVVATSIARWDGSAWSPLGAGLNGTVRALAVYDPGSGPVLIAGGDFTASGALPLSHIAQWDGTAWAPLGSGFDATVHALQTFDAGGGEVLVAGGAFTDSGGTTMSHLASWNGTAWSGLGGGISHGVRALTVFDAGAGPELVAGGSFSAAGGVAARNIASWNGATWSALGAGLTGPVHALTTYDFGLGTRLVVGGDFSSAGGVAVDHLALWDGTTWSPWASWQESLSAQAGRRVYGLESHSSPGASTLTVVGNFQLQPADGLRRFDVARWNGTAWDLLDHGVNVSTLRTVASFGGDLFVGGDFSFANSAEGTYFLRWDGVRWGLAGGPGPHGGLWIDGDAGGDGPAPSAVRALALFDDGHGEVLVAGGDFDRVGEQEIAYIASWDGVSWRPLGLGVDGPVWALRVFDDGSGPKLYAAGRFLRAGGSLVYRIASWDGSTWAPLANGLNGSVAALEVFDDGSGAKLVVGGTILGAPGAVHDGSDIGHLASWDGSVWSALGSGVDNSVHALAAYQSASGPRLAVGGGFTRSGDSIQELNRVASWDGVSFFPMGTGMDAPVVALAAYDDGSGEAVAAGGSFSMAGGGPAARIASWDGTSWTALADSATGSVRALAVDRSVAPARLIAGGDFQLQGPDQGAAVLASWDGAAWATVESGAHHRQTVPQVRALLHRGTGGESDLFIGGVIDSVGTATASSGLGHLACVRPMIFADGFESGDTSAWPGFP